jgi:glycerol-3-phosphate dehydrogenase (NAD(P)+)
MTASVLGAGSWGSALALLLGRNGHDVTLFGRNAHELTIMEVERENFQYLPGFPFPENVKFRHFLDGVEDCDLAVIAVPSNAVEEIAEWLGPHATHVAIASKGLEADTGRLLTDVVADDCPNRIGVLSGPNLAVEIAKGIPTVAVAASASPECAEAIRTGFHSAAFRVSPSSDVVGVELAGALKNVLAIGGGMSDGLGYGDNTKASIITRGLAELSAFASAYGARPETMWGLAGLGDLIATCESPLSRNNTAGRLLGQGYSFEMVKRQMDQTAEGLSSVDPILTLAKAKGVSMPIVAQVQQVLHGTLDPRELAPHLATDSEIPSEE